MKYPKVNKNKLMKVTEDMDSTQLECKLANDLLDINYEYEELDKRNKKLEKLIERFMIKAGDLI